MTPEEAYTEGLYRYLYNLSKTVISPALFDRLTITDLFDFLYPDYEYGLQDAQVEDDY